MRTILDIIIEELEKGIHGEEMDIEKLSGTFILN